VPELSLLKNLVRPEDVTVDVGANYGLYARELARCSRKVHAFEPSPMMADVLRRTSARNIVVHPLALSDHAGTAELRIPHLEGRLTYSLATVEPEV
jgi:FkbM family methyltransferase